MSSSVSEVSSVAAARVAAKLAAAPPGPQVVLFYGEGGGDAGRLAKALAASWMCPASSVLGGCGECSVCRSFAAGRAVDFQHIVPYGAGRFIRLGAIEYVAQEPDPKFSGIPTIDFFRTRPLMAQTKVIWFDPADRLNNDSANALLKTLEELPEHARVVMTTDDLGRVMPTIRSRCLCVGCDLPADLAQVVGELSEAEREFARTPGDVERMRRAPDAFAGLLDLFKRTLNSPTGAAPALAEEARDLAAKLADASGDGARSSQMEVLALLASWWVRYRPEDPGKTAAVIEAHRLVSGNVNAGAVFDMVFARLLV